jgi:hypothetical protein
MSSAAPHPVESSQQNVQLPALDAPHAAVAGGEGSKPKKEKKAAAAGSAFPLEVRLPVNYPYARFLTHMASR